MNFLNSDVPDPTDFPPHATAPGLRDLDGSFRCDICGDLYDAPVTIVCGHCFCSACIRVSLSNKQECPSCRRTTSEAHIRPNPALDKVISDWKKARPFILQLVKKTEQRHDTHSLEEPKTIKKRKRGPSRASSTDTTISGPSHLASSPMRVNTRPTASPSKQRKTKHTDMTIPSSDVDEEEISIPNRGLVPNDDDLVKCPICQTRVKYLKLNEHIDNGCKNPTSSDAAVKTWSRIMTGSKNGKHKRKASDSDDEHPLPIQTYATLKDRQIKEMLQQYDLPVNGNRAIWEQRHQRWVMLHNSNLDRSLANRKSKAELRKDLKKWEDEMLKKKKAVIRDVREYQIQQKDEFSKLIEAARQPRERMRTPP